MEKINTIKVILFISLTFILASCGFQKPLFSFTEDNSQYIPNDVLVSLSVLLSPSIVTSSQLKVFNLSALAQNQSRNAKLPNKSILPLIGESKTIYLSLSRCMTARGVVTPFKTLDESGKKVQATNLIPKFHIKAVYRALRIYS